ncbi:MAG: hypothetical protein ACIAQZ_07170 [Sedimentisphaeraceae bacterium JB056]
MRIMVFILFFQVFLACAADQLVPTENLKIWLVADSVESSTDSFLSTIPNKSNSRYAANQIKIEYRPLYIKNFIENRPVISLSDMRGFSFGALRATTETTVYVGYYKEVHGQDTEFQIVKFEPDDILAKNQKAGFVLGIYNGMLSFHGKPGYSAAFTEFLMYDHLLTSEQDEKIRSYLRARYNLKNDKRYLKSNTLIGADGIIDVSNTVSLANKNMICAVAWVNNERVVPKKSVDLLRSYNYGEKWSKTTIRILGSEEFTGSISPFMYLSGSDILYFFYSKSDSGRKRIAYKFSDDNGYSWSEEILLDVSESVGDISIYQSIHFNGETLFLLKDSVNGPAILRSADIATSLKPNSVTWKLERIDSETLGSDVAGSISMLSHNGNVYCFFTDEDDFLKYISLIDGKDWSDPKKISNGDSYFRNPQKEGIYAVSDSSGILIFFRNNTGLKEEHSDTIWVAKGVHDGEDFIWGCPQIATYNYSYDTESSIEIRSIVNVDNDIKAAFTNSDSAYFCLIGEIVNSDIAPKGVGNFELKGRYDHKNIYDLPSLPSLLTGSVIIDLDSKKEILATDSVIFKIGDDDKKIVFFVEDSRFGLYLKNGKMSSILKTEQYSEEKDRNVVIEVDGNANIMRILVDGSMSNWHEPPVGGWAYFSSEIGQFAGQNKLTIPLNMHNNINKLSIHLR